MRRPHQCAVAAQATDRAGSHAAAAAPNARHEFCFAGSAGRDHEFPSRVNATTNGLSRVWV
jgi:hypothetical protein